MKEREHPKRQGGRERWRGSSLGILGEYGRLSRLRATGRDVLEGERLQRLLVRSRHPIAGCKDKQVSSCVLIRGRRKEEPVAGGSEGGSEKGEREVQGRGETTQHVLQAKERQRREVGERVSEREREKDLEAGTGKIGSKEIGSRVYRGRRG